MVGIEGLCVRLVGSSFLLLAQDLGFSIGRNIVLMVFLVEGCLMELAG